MEEFKDMRSLVDYLNKTAHAYYVLDNPLISDMEWDALYNRLQAMEKETGLERHLIPHPNARINRRRNSGIKRFSPAFCGMYQGRQ